jgi:hypothetical protein
MRKKYKFKSEPDFEGKVIEFVQWRPVDVEFHRNCPDYFNYKKNEI